TSDRVGHRRSGAKPAETEDYFRGPRAAASPSGRGALSETASGTQKGPRGSKKWTQSQGLAAVRRREGRTKGDQRSRRRAQRLEYEIPRAVAVSFRPPSSRRAARMRPRSKIARDSRSGWISSRWVGSGGPQGGSIGGT